MPEVLRIKEPREIPQVLDWIHDQAFDSEGIALDTAAATLTIPFAWADYARARKIWRIWPLAKAEVTTFSCFLRIHHAKSFSARDTERIRYYDFNTLKYDPQSRRITFSTGVPFQLTVDVEDFEISIERTERVINARKALWRIGLIECERGGW